LGQHIRFSRDMLERPRKQPVKHRPRRAATEIIPSRGAIKHVVSISLYDVNHVHPKDVTLPSVKQTFKHTICA
ncbi:hypothetical protein, partial [Sulfitobacter sp. HI0054]|uniref:hypothetical protein n=1 Tax=Sulfitobacter sp. HI0054 TaxID=1822238 RepID=UPI001E5A099F